MSRYSWALGFIVLQLAAAGIGAAQEVPKPGGLPNAPIPKQESTPGAKQETPPQKRDNALHSTIEILARRSVFFPDLAASSEPLRTRQKLELFADQSIAPSQFLSSLAGAGIGQAANSPPGYGQGGDGYAKRFGSSMAT